MTEPNEAESQGLDTPTLDPKQPTAAAALTDPHLAIMEAAKKLAIAQLWVQQAVTLMIQQGRETGRTAEHVNTYNTQSAQLRETLNWIQRTDRQAQDRASGRGGRGI